MISGLNQGDHLETIRAVKRHLGRLDEERLARLAALAAPYLEFRERTRRFHESHYRELCRRACFSRQRADCCGRDGIGVFFADVVIDLLVSGPGEAGRLEAALGRPGGEGCAYLGEGGCVFTLKPVACEMFVCHRIDEEVLAADPALAEEWEALKREEKSFTLPSGPVLFDTLEAIFMEEGLRSPLMFCHTSPGLLKLKKDWA